MRGPTTQQKPASQDWHKADIKAALEKQGWTIRQLAAHHDLNPSTLVEAFYSNYPASQRRIAKAIGVHPMEIWPSRYYQDGTPIRKRAAHLGTNASARAPRGRVKGAVSN